jgi:pyruvate/2-oxoglutarate dehydrogenase complex dihydrolipoamide dehydrogenase (E3) component
VLLKKLEERDVHIMTGFRLSKVEDKGVFVSDNNGKELFLEAESVAITVGNKPYNSLYDQIKSLGIKIHQLGDCLEPRSAKEAIYEGTVIGRDI